MRSKPMCHRLHSITVEETEQTVRVFSAHQVNCSMWLYRRLRNFGYQWTSSSWDAENAGGARPQLPTARKSWNRSTKLTQIQRRQTLVNKHGGFEHNLLTDQKSMQITQHRCDVFELPCDGNQTSSSILDWLQFPQSTIAYTIQKNNPIIQAATNESMYERLNCIWHQRTLHMT